MNLHWIDVLSIILYLSLIAGLGIYFSRKNKNTEVYFLGGRSFPGWAIGLSLVGTSISSVTFISFPGDAFKTSWLRFLPNLIFPVAILIAAYVFLPFFRKSPITSAYEYLESRFGPRVRLYAAIAFLIGQIVRVSTVLFLVSLLLESITGLSPVQSIIIGGIIVSIYTIVGGIDAVIWTDVIQTVVLLIGGILVLIIIVVKLPGGFQDIINIAEMHNKFSFSEYENGVLNPVKWNFTLKNKSGLMMLIFGLYLWLTEYSANQNTVQRYIASKSIKEARKGMVWAVCSSLPIWAFYMFIGTALFVFFTVGPTPETNEMLSGERSAEQVLPFFITRYLPQGITGLVIAAAMAAAMSSLDSSINAISTIGVVDIYKRHFVKDQTDKHYLHVAWIIASLGAISMVGGAILLANAESKTLQDTGVILASLVGGGLLGMYLLGFFTNKGDERSVGIGIVATLLFTTWTILSEKELLPASLRFPFDLYYTGIIGNVIMFCLAYFLSLLFPQKEKDLTNLTLWKMKDDENHDY